MKNILTYKDYSGTVEYSEADSCLFGRIVGIRDIVSYEGESVLEIRQAFEDAVDDYVEHCRSIGKEPNKAYSGKIQLRMPPNLHADLAMQATAQNKSLNQLINEKLVE